MNDVAVSASGLPPALDERFVSDAAFDPNGGGIVGDVALAGASSLALTWRKF